MRYFKFSLRGLLVLCLLVFLLCAALYERNRADKLEEELAAIRGPMIEAIKKQEWNVARRQLAYEFALQQLKPQLDKLQLTEPGEFDQIQWSTGSRRELANLRNAQLKVQREKKKLDQMKQELKASFPNQDQ